MELGIILSLIGIGLSALGLAPVIADSGKYYRLLKLFFSKQDFLIEDVRVTFKIENISKIKVFLTTKYRILRHHSILVLPYTNLFGDVENIIFKLDNRLIQPHISERGDNIVCSYPISDKDIGDAFILDATCVLTGSPSQVDGNEDALSYWVDVYRCRYLRLQVIFPLNFYPDNISFSERPADFSKSSEAKERFGATKLPVLVI